MSKNSEKVKKWRKSTKNRIVQSMGGKCVCCGYNKCNHALALHHLDPSQKDISLGSIRANSICWEKIVKELKKCIMVCHNCHSEIHAGMTEIPSEAAGFDESFASYKDLEKQASLDNCPICGKPKPTYKITCSVSCAAKRQYKVDWDSIDLKSELKTKTIIKLAEELGCSDAAVHKRMKKIGLK
jgi:hypothetical protein